VELNISSIRPGDVEGPHKERPVKGGEYRARGGAGGRGEKEKGSFGQGGIGGSSRKTKHKEEKKGRKRGGITLPAKGKVVN